MRRYIHLEEFCSVRGMPINSTCRVSVDITADESSVNREHVPQTEQENFRQISMYAANMAVVFRSCVPRLLT